MPTLRRDYHPSSIIGLARAASFSLVAMIFSGWAFIFIGQSVKKVADTNTA